MEIIKENKMALRLRRAIVRNVAVNVVLVMVIGLVLSAVSGSLSFDPARMAWLLALSLGLGLFAGWNTIAKIKRGVLQGIPAALSYIRVERGVELRDVKFDWAALEDYAIQLELRGFRSLGYFTAHPMSPQCSGVAACFVDTTASTLIEVQQIRMLKPPAGMNSKAEGFHFSIMSLLAGNIRVTTTDHQVMATNVLISGDLDVAQSFPAMPLLALLEQHARLLATLRKKTGKSPSAGLTMERYIHIQRRRFEQARQRLEPLNGYEIATRIDAFEARPQSQFAPPSQVLAAASEIPLENYDADATGQPPIIEPAAASDMAPAVASPGALIPAPDTPEMAQRRQRLESGANWFYWIAGLSLVNLLIGAAGSDWAFIIGLGISQVFVAIARELAKGTDVSMILIGVLWLLAFAASAFFAVCGWLARRPFVAAFVVGITAFGLDTLIYLLSADLIGVAFHALALYFLWQGLAAARAIKKLASARKAMPPNESSLE